MNNQKLNNKMKLFIEAYDGNTIEAMRIAGYEGTDNQLESRGSDLLQLPAIQDAIRERSKYIASTIRTIAAREERQAVWTSIMRNEDPHYKPQYNKDGQIIPEDNIPIATRLKAAELLGKSEGDFIDRVDIRAQVSITDVISEAYTIPQEKLDAIEAEYIRHRQLKNANAPLVTDETNEDDTFGGLI
jgi:hypothetical protein